MAIPTTTSGNDLLKSGDFNTESNVYGLRAGEAIAATMGLETPQVITRWRYASPLPDIEQVKVRRSTYRFPESTSEGDALLDENQSMNALRSSYADLTPPASEVSYYSVFFQHKGPYSLPLTTAYDLERFGQLRHAYRTSAAGSNTYWVLSRDENGSPVIHRYAVPRELSVQSFDLSGIISDADEQVIAIVNVVATTSFQLVTTKRYIQVSFTADPITTVILPSHITAQFNLQSLMAPGYVVAGACRHGSNLLVLDSSNKQVVQMTLAGALTGTSAVLTSLPMTESPIGVGSDGTAIFVGYGKVIYKLTLTATPVYTDILGHFPVRQPLKVPFMYDSGTNQVNVVDNDLHWLQAYNSTTLLTNVTQIEEPAVPYANLKGLWRFDELTGAAVDSSGAGFNGIVASNVVRGETGKFGKAIRITDETQGVDLTSGSGAFDIDNGAFSIWWKSPYKGYRATTVPRLLFLAIGPTRNVLLYALVGGEILLRMTRNSVLHDVTFANGQAILDDGLFHNLTGIWSGGNGGTMTLYVDGVSVGSVALTQTGGAMTAMGVGGTGADAQLGYYDDLAVYAGASFTPFTRYSLTTRGSRAHSLAGRDYNEEGQHWRDQFKKEFDEFPLRTDFGISALPSNQVLSDGETIFRESTDRLTLGNLGRLSRLFGLFLDRVTDYRKHFKQLGNLNKVEYEFIDWLGEVIGAFDVNESWNVEKRRRFLETMYFCYQRSGTFDALARLTRFLGYWMLAPDPVVGTLIQTYRGFFDSCLDPDRVDVPFDSITFDSSNDDTQLVDVISRFFIQNRAASVASTSVPATRQLTDATATFTSQAAVGSLIVINDQDDKGDNGQYIITTVNSGTVVTVDRDFPVGSLTGLQYRLYWRIPPSDPYNEEILARLNKIKVRWQNLVVNL